MFDEYREQITVWLAFAALLIAVLVKPAVNYIKVQRENRKAKRQAEIKSVMTAVMVEGVKALNKAQKIDLDHRDEKLRGYMVKSISEQNDKLKATIYKTSNQAMDKINEIQQSRAEEHFIIETVLQRTDRLERFLLPVTLDIKNKLGLDKRETDPIRIMMVDDDDDFVHMVKLLLEQQFDVPIIFSSAQEIVAGARVRAEIILLDLGLGTTEGIETLKAMNELAPHTKIIVMASSPELGAESIRNGAIEFIPKDNVRIDGELMRVIQITLLRPHPLQS